LGHGNVKYIKSKQNLYTCILSLRFGCNPNTHI